MKKTLLCIIVIYAFMVILTGCATTGQKSAIQRGENKDIIELLLTEPVEPPPIGDVTQLSYIVSKSDSTILSIDGSAHNGSWTFVSPGTHVLVVQYYVVNSYNTISYDAQGRKITETHRTESKSEPMRVQYIFETGKSYYLEYEIEKGATIFNNRTINFSIIELTDKKEIENGKKRLATYETNYKNAVITYHENVEKRQQFLAFSEANPLYLEGIWIYSRKYPWEDIEIIFNNKRFMTTSFNRMSKNTYNTEGTFFFNENTIILYYETMQKRNILYYELKDGIFYIKSGGNDAIVTAGGLKGEYSKK